MKEEFEWTRSQRVYERKAFKEFLHILSRKYIHDPRVKIVVKENVIFFLKNVLQENFQREVKRQIESRSASSVDISKPPSNLRLSSSESPAELF